jgi:hypothetical protein
MVRVLSMSNYSQFAGFLRVPIIMTTVLVARPWLAASPGPEPSGMRVFDDARANGAQDDFIGIVVYELWLWICPRPGGECWREIALRLDGGDEGAAVFKDRNRTLESGLDAHEAEKLQELLADPALRAALATPLAPMCEGWKGTREVRITAIRRDGRKMTTRWAEGCLADPTHPFAKAYSLAVDARVSKVECELYEETVFDPYDVVKLPEATQAMGDAPLKGLCYPCGGRC